MSGPYGARLLGYLLVLASSSAHAPATAGLGALLPGRVAHPPFSINSRCFHESVCRSLGSVAEGPPQPRKADDHGHHSADDRTPDRWFKPRYLHYTPPHLLRNTVTRIFFAVNDRRRSYFRVAMKGYSEDLAKARRITQPSLPGGDQGTKERRRRY